jgi:hypothetical protein
MIAACVLTPTFAHAAAPKTKAEHITIAEKYEERATEQDAIAEEHIQMLKDYKANAARYPKQVREKRIAAMKKHCTAIIRDSKRLANDYRAIAKWHRIAATDLEEPE